MTTENEKQSGNQRLPLESLLAWESLKYGMFIHYGMSTYDGDELSRGNKPSTFYAPDRLDVDQWISVARDCGMKYAVLTAKHVSGHCLWPSRHTDYHVGTSNNTTDVVEAFVNACDKHGIMPGLYYCSWDNHHLFGSKTPSMTSWDEAFTSRDYQDFQTAQIEEILTQYGNIGEVWIDIPCVLPRGYRHDLYRQITSLQPDALVMMNTGIGDGSTYPVANAWPADLVALERFLPNSHTGYVKWHEIEGKTYYMPGEVCDPIGNEWFFTEDDQPRSDEELLGMYLLSISRGTNLLLDVGPDKHGLIPKHCVDALNRLHINIERFAHD